MDTLAGKTPTSRAAANAPPRRRVRGIASITAPTNSISPLIWTSSFLRGNTSGTIATNGAGRRKCRTPEAEKIAIKNVMRPGGVLIIGPECTVCRCGRQPYEFRRPPVVALTGRSSRADGYRWGHEAAVSGCGARRRPAGDGGLLESPVLIADESTYWIRSADLAFARFAHPGRTVDVIVRLPCHLRDIGRSVGEPVGEPDLDRFGPGEFGARGIDRFERACDNYPRNAASGPNDDSDNGDSDSDDSHTAGENNSDDSDDSDGRAPGCRAARRQRAQLPVGEAAGRPSARLLLDDRLELLGPLPRIADLGPMCLRPGLRQRRSAVHPLVGRSVHGVRGHGSDAVRFDRGRCDRLLPRRSRTAYCAAFQRFGRPGEYRRPARSLLARHYCTTRRIHSGCALPGLRRPGGGFAVAAGVGRGR